MIGGYLLIDLENKKIDDESGAIIPGLYEKIEGATVPICIKGLNLDGTEMKPCFISPYVASGDYEFVVGLATVNIDDDNLVTFSYPEEE